MHRSSEKGWLLLGIIFLTLSSISHAQQSSADVRPGTIAPAVTPTPLPANSRNAAPSGPVTADSKLQEAFDLMTSGKIDPALAASNQALEMDPKNLRGYLLRGEVYTIKEQFDLAQKDYETAEQLDQNNVIAKFNLAELQFRQKQYDAARPAFAALENDTEYGDLVSYKVFLCDLLGGHEDVAAKELEAFNQPASKPSYYFSNVAWSVAHHKTEEARDWLASALRIYSAKKINLYASTLKNLGYLPLPPVPSAE